MINTINLKKFMKNLDKNYEISINPYYANDFKLLIAAIDEDIEEYGSEIRKLTNYHPMDVPDEKESIWTESSSYVNLFHNKVIIEYLKVPESNHGIMELASTLENSCEGYNFYIDCPPPPVREGGWCSILITLKSDKNVKFYVSKNDYLVKIGNGLLVSKQPFWEQ
jgi:hypothetical protein